MSLRTVGIEFQSKGERETVAAIGRVDSAQKKLASTSNALKSAVEREVTTAANAVRAYKLLRDAGMSYSDVLRGLDQNTKMLGQAHQAHINSLLGVDRSSKSARDSANALAQAFRQQEAQVENASRSYNQLIASINPTVAAQQRMRQVHETVRAALAAEIITRDQAAQTLREYRALSLQGAAGVNSMAAANQFASRSMNGTGMAMQQVGYQVGDFLVQVQSGTNAFVAFGQQATQLVGILPLMGAGFLGLSTGGLIALASGLGIAIPLVTALGAAFVRTRQSGEESLNALEQSIETLTSRMREARDEAQRFAFGVGTTEEALVLREILDLNIEIESVRRSINDLEQLGAITATEERRLQNLIEQRDELEGILEAEQRRVEIAQMASDAAETFARFTEMRSELENQTRLYQLIAQYGEESLQVETERAAQAREAFEAEARRAGILGGNLETIMAQYDAQVRASEEAARTEEILARIAGMDMPITARIMQLAAALDITAGAAARLMANLPGGSGAAGSDPTISGFESADPRSGLPGADSGTTGEAGQITLPPVGGGGGGGGGGASAFQSQIEGIRALQEAIAAAEEQAALFGQEVDLLDSALQHGLITQQEYNTLLTQAQEAYGQAQTAAYDYEAAIEQISNTASSAMEDAFMSIVDGSATAADAFRNMAREILAEAFKMLVVRPIMNSLFGGGGGGFLGGLFGGVSKNEYGNAFHAGRVIPFANGGVVSSPTMFPMRGNQTGLMGEAGPEAIMPLKRGRDGKLGVQAEGGGQSIVIHQSFNFQANGDESVKRIIAQEAPKIANLTQQQIIDQRKRGGVMKATF